MKSFSKMLCFIFLPAAALLSCQMIEDSVSASDELASEMVNIDFVTTEGHTVLGDVIDIPYSIENLLKAYENLPVQTKSQIDLKDIQPTHYYVRFYPKSIEEQDILRNIKPYVFLSETPLNQVVLLSFTLSDAKEYLKMMKPAYISDNQIESYYSNYVGL